MSTKNLMKLVLCAVTMAGGVSSCAQQIDLSSTEDDVALPPPTNLTVVNVRSDRQDLSWDPSPGAVKYIIMRGPSTGTETSYTECCLNGPPFIANHLTASTQYCWEVKNVNSGGQSSAPSNEVCLTTPAIISPPATVTATAISGTTVNVSWTAVTGAAKYYVNQSANGGAYTRIGSILSPNTSFNNTGLTAATQYCYTVQAEDSGGNVSAVSSPPACTVTFLSGLEGYWKFDETTGTVAADSSGFGRNATLSGGAAFTISGKAPIDDNKSMLSIDATSTSVATTPTVAAYRLTGAFSVAFWADIPTAASSVLMLGMHNSGSCGAGALGWEISQGAGGLAFVSQTATRSFGTSLATGTWTHVAVTYAGGAGGTMRLYLNGSQVASTTYSASNSLSAPVGIGHVAGCAGGAVILDELQILSREMSASEVALIGTLPPAPTGLTITSTNSTVMNLAWTAPATGATKWVIMRGTAPGNEINYTHAPNPPTTFNADHLTAGTQYSWEVKTVQNGLVSLPSNEVVGTTNGAPAAPTGVTATAISQTRINVSWNAVTNATKYYVYMSTSGGPYSAVGSVLAPTLTFQKANLTANTTYSFEIQAEDAGLTRSAMSAPATATTLP